MYAKFDENGIRLLLPQVPVLGGKIHIPHYGDITVHEIYHTEHDNFISYILDSALPQYQEKLLSHPITVQ